ncbi:MAG: Uma2 family endonuclease [Dehalococcoidia bacterium]
MPEAALLMTGDEFQADPAFDSWELIDGVPIDMIQPYLTNVTTMKVAYHLMRFTDLGAGLTVASSRQRFQIWPGRPNHIRKPDLSYFVESRVPDMDSGDLTVAPDLVVEVVSTHEDAVGVERKRIDYLEAGVRLVWVVFPQTKTVHVYRSGGLAEILSVGDTLTGNPVLPGFAFKALGATQQFGRQFGRGEQRLEQGCSAGVRCDAPALTPAPGVYVSNQSTSASGNLRSMPRRVRCWRFRRAALPKLEPHLSAFSPAPRRGILLASPQEPR